MISGRVSANLEARITLEVRDAAGATHSIEAEIDTGFNGFLTLPPALVTSLGLPWLSRQKGMLNAGGHNQCSR